MRIARSALVSATEEQLGDVGQAKRAFRDLRAGGRAGSVASAEGRRQPRDADPTHRVPGAGARRAATPPSPAARNGYIIRGGTAGRERLCVLARAARPSTAALLDRVGLALGMRCLDVGSGGGDVTRELARRVAPDGSAVGIELDETKVALARGEADGDAIGNVEYRVGDILATELAPEYDAIYIRFLLTHLADPAAAISRIAAGLRPGGMLVVEDIEVSGSLCHPDSAAFERYLEVYGQTARARGFDPEIGPRLPGLLRQAGLAPVSVNVAQPAGIGRDGFGRDVKLLSPLTLENIADAAIAEGVISRDELEEVLDELYRLAADPTTLITLPRIIQSWGWRVPRAKV
jgi:2-polyprenyl-3-methyl-5-hydroxy-6-metoxy-1,4-benzoquinol methylase